MKTAHIIILLIAVYLIYTYYRNDIYRNNIETFDISTGNSLATFGIIIGVFGGIILLILAGFYFYDNRKRLPFDTTPEFQSSGVPLPLLGDPSQQKNKI